MSEDNAGANERKTILVAGLGMVGIAFIEKILNLDEEGRYRIVTCGEEVHLAYNRVALTDYFQHRNVEKLYLNPPEWYTQQHPSRFIYHIGETVTLVNHEAHTAMTDKNRSIPYDYCVLATGSDATLPSFVDPDIEGVFVYRNISDLNRLLSYSEKLQHKKSITATVIGGGLLGLEAAKALYDLESVTNVKIVIRGSYPLSRQLDDQGGEIVLRRIQAMGVEVLTHASTKRLVTSPIGGIETLTALEMEDGSSFETDIVIFAIGITPRDSLARDSAIRCSEGGPQHRGVIVDDQLRTSATDVFAIGECASWKGHTYGLIAPGIEMADILAFNMTQLTTAVGDFKPRQMNTPDLSTKLKLMGVDVASFGDFFAEKRQQSKKVTTETRISTHDSGAAPKHNDASSPRKRHGLSNEASEGPVETLTYRDPFAGVYKKYIFSPDGKHLLGGMMVGDTGDYIKLVSLVKKKKSLEVPPSQFILGARKGGDEDINELDDDTQICSCHNVTKGQIAECVKSGVDTLNGIKAKTKAGTGCGMPLVTSIFKAEMQKAGHQMSNNLCPHFAMSRADLFNVVNNQDTNDRFLANIQRNDGLYTKITGGQRIDLFGAQKPDLPSIWSELVDAGFESGHAYGKSLRTVKSCVGTSWCRYGIGDSVGLAIQLEERYKGIRSPHKFKGGVSGCVRECAEAQGKDFGLIATDKGWNRFETGATPRHATLFARDVPPSKVVRILDRFLMYYIRTADKLMRTARWLETMEGGIEKLQKVLLDDSLGICEDLEKEMDELDVRQAQIEQMVERGQTRPADWSKEAPPLKIKAEDVGVPRSEWQWRKVAKLGDLTPSSNGTTAAAIKYGDSQIAIFHVPRKGYFATQQMCPHKRAFVLEHGIIGDDPTSGAIYVSCPMHKRNFNLASGDCLNDENYSILSFEVKVEDDAIFVLLPETTELDAVIGTQKWMVRRDSSLRNSGSVEIVGPKDVDATMGNGCANHCGDSRLDW
ncbi:hypothetical protein NLI96_g11777 [Meripilus lineatus]|uniref:Rieske domain-containing protein n=1 Tax=Meripilus lineatus TaxID=2056292 RepID=A0AAD5Y860_9APHY|nr:hypothetical protein NLI96_g11777 [Physisporinus lineatus]